MATAYDTATAITLSATNLPTSYNVTASPTHGTLSGTAPNLSYTPAAGYAGADSFTFTATNGGGTSAPATVSITVGNPVVTLSGTASAGTRGTTYSTTFTVSGGAAPYTYAISAGALPAGLALSTSGTLSGTPTASGSFNFSVTATDSSTGNGPFTATQGYTLSIAAPSLSLAPSTLSAASVGSAFSQNLSANGGTAPYGYAITAGALPVGLALSSGGTLSGTPSAGGSYNFTVTATDSSSGASGGPYTVSTAYTLTVVAPNVTLSPTNLPDETSGTAYGQTFTAGSGTAPYTFAITSGALPFGLTLSSSGALSGTPTASGSFTFSVSATDSSTGTGPYTATRGYTLAIAPRRCRCRPPPYRRDRQHSFQSDAQHQRRDGPLHLCRHCRSTTRRTDPVHWRHAIGNPERQRQLQLHRHCDRRHRFR